MALKRERNPLDNTNRGEKAPTVHEPPLPKREAHSLDWQQTAIMKDEAMNHPASKEALF
jgi:hypothetical protein